MSLLKDHITESLVLRSFQEGLIAFYQLLRSPWWRRSWICQEFIVAREADLLYGGVSMTWQDFASVLHHLEQPYCGLFNPLSAHYRTYSESGGHDDSHLELLDQLFELVNLGRSQLNSAYLLTRRKHDWTEPGDLKVWLHYARRCEASDPRDKVFAFLGLASDRYNIIPDYSTSRSMEEVFVDVARKIIATEKTVEVLCYVGERDVSSDGLLPSWVPDWSSQSSEIMSGYFARPSPKLELAAHQPISSSHKPLVLQDGTTLRVEGIRIDSLEPRQLLQDHRNGLERLKTKRGLICHGWPEVSSQDSDCLWYFPGTSDPFVLRPQSNYWLLLSVAAWKWTLKGDRMSGSNISFMIMRGDVTGVLGIRGLKREVIEIH
jgi:hypothetical protein